MIKRSFLCFNLAPFYTLSSCPAFGANRKEIATNYNNIAQILQKQKKYKDAIGYVEKALKICLELYGERNKDVFLCYNSLGILYDNVKNYRQAFFYHKKSYDIALVLWGSEDKEVKTSAWNVADILYSMKEYKQARYYAEKALHLNILLSGEYSQNTLSSYSRMGDICFQLKDYENVISYYEKAVDIALRLEYDKLNDTLWKNLRNALKKRKRHSAFEHRAKKYMALLQKKNNEEQMLLQHRRLMDFYADENKLTEVRNIFTVSLAMRQRIYGKVSSQVSMIYWAYAENLYSMMHYKEAQNNYQLSLDTDLALKKKPWGDIILNTGNIAYCLHEQGKYAESAAKCNAVLDLIRRYQPKSLSSNGYKNLLQTNQFILSNHTVIFKIKSITPGGEAEKLGLKAGDIFLEFGNWKWNKRIPLYHKMPQLLSAEFDRLDSVSKKIVFARKNERGYEIVNAVFPKGKIGVVYSWEYLPEKWAMNFAEDLKRVK